RDQLRRGRVDLGTAGPVAGRDRPGRPDPAVGRRGTRRGPDYRHRRSPGGAVMRRAVGNYELDDDPARIDPAAAAAFLTTEAYWGRWRTAHDITRQIGTPGGSSGRMTRRARWSAWPARSATAGPPTWPTCTCCPRTAAAAWARPSSR